MNGEIVAHVDFIRLLSKNDRYCGQNEEIRAYPGLKVLSLYHQFGGIAPCIDAVLILTAEALGVKGTELESMEAAKRINDVSNVRYLGKPISNDALTADMVHERNGVDLTYVLRVLQAFHQRDIHVGWAHGIGPLSVSKAFQDKLMAYRAARMPSDDEFSDASSVTVDA